MGIENSVRLIGNLGDDPQVKYTQGGMAITEIRVATTSRRKDKGGNAVEETQWHRVKFFGKLAEIAGEYLRKGSSVAIEGSIRYGEYEKDGVKRYTTDIIADHMKMLGGRRDGEQGDGQRQQRQTPQRNAPTQQAPAEGGFADDFEDSDIPF